MITKMFPEINEVFEKDGAIMKEYFFPICSFNLSTINPEWNEVTHFLIFNEDPYNEETVQYFNHFCEESSIGFRLKENKLDFLTDIRFMHVTDKWNKWLTKTKDTYQKSKEDYFNDVYEKDFKSLIKIGGEPEWIQYPEIPKNERGEELIFIGQFYTGDFTNDFCGKDIFIFYDSKEKTIVHKYQIT